MSAEHVRLVEELAQDIDMVIFRMERGAPADDSKRAQEQRRTRNELEGFRDRLRDLAYKLEI